MSLDSQVDGTAVHDQMDGHDGVRGLDGVGGRWVSFTRVAELEATVAQLREAVVSRQQLGFVTGLVAGRLGLTPDDAWAVLVRLSQDTNVKVREVGRVIHDAYCGRLAPEDEALAARLDANAPKGTSLVARHEPLRR